MKILKKRILAVVIDYFLYGSIITVLSIIFSETWKFFLDSCGVLVPLVLLPLVCRDFIFQNASLGKKLMGLRIYDKNWKKPSLKTLFFRSLGMSTFGYIILLKAFLAGDSFIVGIDWEFNCFGTVVIPNKLFKELDKTAKESGNRYDKKMTELYFDKLQKEYIK